MASFHNRWSKKVAFVSDSNGGRGGVAACLTWDKPKETTLTHGVTVKKNTLETSKRTSTVETNWTKYNVSTNQNTKVFSNPISNVFEPVPRPVFEDVHIPAQTLYTVDTDTLRSDLQDDVIRCQHNLAGDYSHDADRLNRLRQEYEVELQAQLEKEAYENERLSEYGRELEYQMAAEAFKADKMREYEAYLKTNPSTSCICREHLDEALKTYQRNLNLNRPITGKFSTVARVNGRPPIGRRAQSAKTIREVAVVEDPDCTMLKKNLRISRPCSAALAKSRPTQHQCPNHYQLPNHHKYPNQHVMFDLPRGASTAPQVKKPLLPKNGADHFFEWRNSSTNYVPATPFDPWKVTSARFNEKPKTWRRAAHSAGAKRDLLRTGTSDNKDGAVNLQFTCPEDEQLKVNLQVQRAPSRGY